MTTARRLLFVTGTRADFGKLDPLARAAQDAGHEVQFFVTGMHMMDRYGLTKIEVTRSWAGQTHEFANQAPGDAQDKILATTVLGFSDYCHAAAPDLVIVHGDRVEALACALVCATNYIRCAHIEGGEVSGTIDELFRHCNTKLAWCHFVSSAPAAARVRAMGEADARVFPIGSPELDFHAGPSGVSLDDVRDYYEIPFADYGVCTFHPVTSEQDHMGAQAQALFAALQTTGKNFVVILPNNDPGADGILDVIASLPKPQFRVLPSMRFAHFSELMKQAAVIVGNSSAGVREAPFLGIPSIDIGSRQNRRATSPSICALSAHDQDGVVQAINTLWGQRFDRDPSFGRGQAAREFVTRLSDPAFWAQGFQKAFED